jgi:hypothetical protein
VAQSRWNQRGWTLQELVFSQRALFYHEHTVTWECHCAIWHEKATFDSENDSCLIRFNPQAWGLQYALWPDLEEYSRLVQNYSQRQLTFREDIVPAFSGITMTLSQSFQNGFIFGLPELFFDVALLWRFETFKLGLGTSYQIMIRDMTHSVATLPSWSWMGWHGEEHPFDLSVWSSGYGFIQTTKIPTNRTKARGKINVQTIPICDWFVKTPDGKRRISNSFLQYIKCAEDENIPFPDGWQRKNGFFTHPVDPHTKFNYPIPLVDSRTAIDSQPNSNLLVFTTRRAWFKGTGGGSWPRLLDDELHWAGILTVHVDKIARYKEAKFMQPPPNRWYGEPEHNPWEDQRFELIAISAGSSDLTDESATQFIAEHHELRKHRPDLRIWEFYNVLWIDWQDGIAYRLGIGRVDKATWEKQATEELEVTLG